jgi:transglutaminase-like putative cysteine protease
MKFNVSSALEFTASTAGTIVLNIHALRTPSQTVLKESFSIEPYIKSEEIISAEGNRLLRFEVTEPGNISIKYQATVDNCYKISDHSQLQDVPLSQIDVSILPYLYPSRYCQVDKLYRLAHNLFGNIESSFDKVMAICTWIHTNVQYLSGSTNVETSAFDTVTEQQGVCRDFAHLGIALCRALTIPARYFTGYAYQLQPPDFHACFEAYLGGEWVFFDATNLMPLNGMIKIATGRDAADTALANIWGEIELNAVNVGCELVGNDFEPFYYQPDGTLGISYPL